ncbi:MAG TPA: universal stress protein [Flavobacteriales bacterium]|nr:universal stress protein [Flavobacteriales bacterium]
MSSKKYIVAYDFSIVSETALNHAVKVAKTTGGTIHLLHVVPKPAQLEEARTHLQQVAGAASRADGVTVEAIVRIGNIFDDIADYSEEIKAELVFMGTHGTKGWQKISGSYAMKVIESTFTPFIVVQQRKIKDTGYDDIVVPLDLDKNTQQKLRIVAELAKYFNSKAHIVMPLATNSDDKIDLKINLAFAQKQLKEHNIDFNTVVLDGDFPKEIIKYAVVNDCDLIMIVNSSVEKIAGNLFASSHEQAIITNDAQIPVCLINPKDLTTGGSSIFN